MNDGHDISAIEQTLANSRWQLFQSRSAGDHWEGALSSSALSTATAVCALEAYRKAVGEAGLITARQLSELIDAGRRWLADHQNADGGWGDTTKSLSNISTTALGWAALADADHRYRPSEEAAESSIRQAAGDVTPQVLAEAIRSRYGKDRTFSVPILTTLALTGRLGSKAEAWGQIPQLPFELAACPHQWFAALKLPVVSYALPALIAMGQVRHHHLPVRNPLGRWIRQANRARTLRVLQSIQPADGGFLEAAPLTSFVALSLIAVGHSSHPVVTDSVRFLVASVRDDGSWPIDTHLATWVTSLSIVALGHKPGFPDSFLGSSSAEMRTWLLDQQHLVEHPYTHAAPGGWSWTPLAGGVPDADDTAAALLALLQLDDGSPRLRKAIAAGAKWLLDLQNRDGGIPTFCRGWGTLPFDRSSADITAHAIRAWLVWQDTLPATLRQRLRRQLPRAVGYLARTQQPTGAWAPLWFGNQDAPDETNRTYGTSRVLLAIAALEAARQMPQTGRPDSGSAIGWLLDGQNPDGGWGGGPQICSSVEETALATEALCALMATPASASLWPDPSLRGRVPKAVRGGLKWLVEHTLEGTSFDPSPIGFYFAKLWFFERLYPLIFTVAAMSRAQLVRQQVFPASSTEAGAKA